MVIILTEEGKKKLSQNKKARSSKIRRENVKTKIIGK